MEGVSRSTHLAHAFIALDEAVDRFDSKETRVYLSTRLLNIRVENIRCNDCSQVVDVHLTAGLFVHSRE